jgi:ABC-type multidrug transport system ATPase subunit
MNAPLIRTRDLAKKFGLLCAVQGVTLQIDVPGIVAIVGPNGAGKTTLMRMLVGGINPSGGYAEIVGCDVCERGPLLASKIGYLPERLALYEELRVEESLIYFANLRG